jgi:hypothetical protein
MLMHLITKILYLYQIKANKGISNETLFTPPTDSKKDK